MKITIPAGETCENCRYQNENFQYCELWNVKLELDFMVSFDCKKCEKCRNKEKVEFVYA